jgi:hypothetical protein
VGRSALSARRARELPSDPVEELEDRDVAGDEPGLEQVEGQGVQLGNALGAIGQQIAVRHHLSSPPFLNSSGWWSALLCEALLRYAGRSRVVSGQ